MWPERLRKLLFESQHFSAFIGILFPALIAPDRETVRENRKRHVGICLRKGDSMTEKKILANMKPMILAENPPAIMAIFPHTIIPQIFVTYDHHIFMLVL
jgi:hypothetical protein